MRKAFLSSTAAATQQGWSSLWKLKLLNIIITLFYGVFAIWGLVGGALQYCHTFQLDPFLVANKTFLPASDPAGIRWSRPLYLCIDQPFPLPFKISKHTTAITHETNIQYIPVGQSCSPHQLLLASLFINASSKMFCWNYYSWVSISHKIRIGHSQWRKQQPGSRRAQTFVQRWWQNTLSLVHRKLFRK